MPCGMPIPGGMPGCGYMNIGCMLVGADIGELRVALVSGLLRALVGALLLLVVTVPAVPGGGARTEIGMGAPGFMVAGGSGMWKPFCSSQRPRLIVPSRPPACTSTLMLRRHFLLACIPEWRSNSVGDIARDP